MKESLICIPTYNEEANVELVIQGIFKTGYSGDILFIDDASTDGTMEKLQRLVQKHKNIFCINRPEKMGIGSAHKDGIEYAYENNYEKIITMDCDFSHSPEYIDDFIKCSSEADIVIGSRFNKKESLKGWNIYRKILTYAGHYLYKNMLDLNYDATGAYRLYNLRNIPRTMFDLINSLEYSYFFESLYIMKMNGKAIEEIDIVLPPRTYGHSKMSYRNILQSVYMLLYLYIKSKVNRESLYCFEHSNPGNYIPNHGTYVKDGENSAAKIKEEWDKYWKVNTNNQSIIYELIAAFYRKYIIKRSLNFYIRKYYKTRSKLLHAGCGSGQVDADITNEMKVTGLDISEYALSIYKKVNPSSEEQIQGDIFSSSIPDRKYDGVYNLGVMEHFTEEEIEIILNEFSRILKDDGTILLFWPPEYGLSVTALKAAHFILRKFLGNHRKLHPDEITRIESRDHIRRILKKSRLIDLKMHFGFRDFFTYAVVVCKKNI